MTSYLALDILWSVSSTDVVCATRSEPRNALRLRRIFSHCIHKTAAYSLALVTAARISLNHPLNHASTGRIPRPTGESRGSANTGRIPRQLVEYRDQRANPTTTRRVVSETDSYTRSMITYRLGLRPTKPKRYFYILPMTV